MIELEQQKIEAAEIGYLLHTAVANFVNYDSITPIVVFFQFTEEDNDD